MYKDREVGQRTVLDTLNADAELLDAQVGLVRARHDAVAASISVMAATGGLTGEALGFSGVDDPKAYLGHARGNIFGTSVEPLDGDTKNINPEVK